MIRNLLVGLDGSSLAEVVLPYVETIAKATDATVTLVRVVPPQASTEPLRDENAHLIPFTVIMPSERPHAADESARNERYEAEHYLDAIVKRLGAHGIVGNAVVEAGDPASVILDEARERQSDLVLLVTHGRSGLGRLIYGSVAEAVVEKSPIPVFLARASTHGLSPQFGESAGPILVALDSTKEAERALPLAQELAKAISTGLSLVQIVPPFTPMTVSDGVWASDIPLDIQVREEEMARDYLTVASEKIRANGISVVASVRTDTIGAGIVAVATECNASLIVMATHAPTGLARALAGSVALEVLHRGTLPVLLIGPQVESSTR